MSAIDRFFTPFDEAGITFIGKREECQTPQLAAGPLRPPARQYHKLLTSKGYTVEPIPDLMAAAARAGQHGVPVQHPSPVPHLARQPLKPSAKTLFDEAWDQVEHGDCEDTVTPLLFSFDEPPQMQAPMLFDAEEESRAGQPCKPGERADMTGCIPAGKDDMADPQRSDVGKQPPASEGDSWVSVQLSTQKAKWQQKLQSAKGDYARVRKGLRDQGLSHQEIEADKGLRKAIKRVAAIEHKLESLEGGERQVRDAQQAMVQPMQAFTRGEISEAELNDQVKPELAKITKVFGGKKVQEWYRSGKVAVQRKAIELRFNWPEYIMAAAGDVEGWVRSTMMSEHGLPSTAAWVASFAIVKGLSWLKKGVAAMKKRPQLEAPKQHARRQVPDEVVELVHEWMRDLAKAMEIDAERVPSKEQLYERLSGRRSRGEARHFAKDRAGEDAKVLAALLNGTAAGDLMFVPIAKGRQARVRVLNVTKGDTVQGPAGEPEPLIIIDSRDETGQGTYSGNSLYFCYGSGEIDLKAAKPIDPGDTEAICSELRKGCPKEPDELDRFRPAKQFSAEAHAQDDFLDVAEQYAERWNGLLASGETIPDEQRQQAEQDLAGSGWELAYDGDEFVVAELAPFVNPKTGEQGRISQTGKVSFGELKRKR